MTNYQLNQLKEISEEVQDLASRLEVIAEEVENKQGYESDMSYLSAWNADLETVAGSIEFFLSRRKGNEL